MVTNRGVISAAGLTAALLLYVAAVVSAQKADPWIGTWKRLTPSP